MGVSTILDFFDRYRSLMTCLFTLFFLLLLVLFYKEKCIIFFVLLPVSLFYFIGKWSKYEFIWRFSFFILSGLFFILAATNLIIKLEVGSLFNFLYIFCFIIILDIPFVLWLKGKFRIFDNRFSDAITGITPILVLIVIFVILGFQDLEIHLLSVSGIFVMLLMLNYLFETKRRSRFTKILEEIGNFTKPADFVERVLEKVGKNEEEKAFLEFRFNEFLYYIERGAFEYSYVTLATGILEYISVWNDKKDKRPTGWDITHNDIRAAIVHSLPKKKTGSKDVMVQDLMLKINNLKKFRKDPFTPIADLLEELVKKYQI